MMPDEGVPVQVVQTDSDIDNQNWWQFSDDQQVIKFLDTLDYICTCTGIINAKCLHVKLAKNNQGVKVGS